MIFRQGFTIRGLTTAASLWLVAAIGMAAGAGYWKGAVIATGAALVSLRPLEWLKARMLPQRAASRIDDRAGRGRNERRGARRARASRATCSLCAGTGGAWRSSCELDRDRQNAGARRRVGAAAGRGGALATN